MTIRISLISSNSHENVGEYTGALHSTTNVQCTYHHELVTGDVSTEGNVISFRGVDGSQDILSYYEQMLDSSTHELETKVIIFMLSKTIFTSHDIYPFVKERVLKLGGENSSAKSIFCARVCTMYFVSMGLYCVWK